MSLRTTTILAALAGAQFDAALAAPLTQPPIVPCNANEDVTLDVVRARASLSSPSGGTSASFDSRLYAVNGGTASFPGATLSMRPGEQCSVTVENSLDADPSGSACHSVHGHENSLHCPDTTNLHTHGLHVAPDEDDVSSVVEPGESRVYTYNVPAEHMAGTHWFHAHRHGSTGLQVGGGLAGMLLMEHPAEADPLPADIAALYGEDGLDGTVAVMSHIFFDNGETGNDAFAIPDMTMVAAEYANTLGTATAFDADATFADDALKDAYVVNGQYQPTLELTANEVHLVRFVNAVGTRILSLEVEGTGSDDCEMQLLARDGVFQRTPYPSVRAVAMFPATRADIAIRCTGDAVGSSTLAFAARADVFDSNFDNGNTGLVHDQDVVMHITVAASTAALDDFPTSQVSYPAYLSDWREEELATFADGSSSQDLLLTAGAGNFQINGESFVGFEVDDRHLVEGLCLDSVYEFNGLPPGPGGGGGDGGGAGGGGGGGGGGPPRTRQAATSMHPLHIHIDHMLVTAVPDMSSTSGEVIRIGEFRDTVGIPAPNGFTFRMKMHDFVGDAVLHCHLTYHEDNGMMGLMERKTCGAASGGDEGDESEDAGEEEEEEEGSVADGAGALACSTALMAFVAAVLW